MQNTSNIRMPKFFNNFSTFHFHFHNQHEELANIKTKNEGIDKELKLAQQRMNEGNQFRKEKREKEKMSPEEGQIEDFVTRKANFENSIFQNEKLKKQSLNNLFLRFFSSFSRRFFAGCQNWRQQS